MPDKPLHMVLTTISVPHTLYDYLDNFRRFGHLETVKVWVIGDRKTPAGVKELARDISRQGLETVYLDLADQDRWGTRCSAFYRRLPRDNETRRNIGFLCALEDGCQTLISIDDDIYPGTEDFAGGHRKTGQSWTAPLVHEQTGFHNICEHLAIEPARPLYPRGFPFFNRQTINRPEAVPPPEDTRIGVNAGLWTGAPDLDAITWLNEPVESRSFTGNGTCVLSQKTWIPISSQNVSITRELIPACLCVPMGWELPGGSIQRYGDIWGGYFLQALMKKTNYHVAFGPPIVDHQRNPHHLLDDLRGEYWGMLLTDWLVDLLQSHFFPRQSEMNERIEELAEFIEEISASRLPVWCPESVSDFMRWTAGNLSAWAAACRQFL